MPRSGSAERKALLLSFPSPARARLGGRERTRQLQADEASARPSGAPSCCAACSAQKAASSAVYNVLERCGVVAGGWPKPEQIGKLVP